MAIFSSVRGSDVHEKNRIGMMAGTKFESFPTNDKGSYTEVAKADLPGLRKNIKHDGRKAREI